MNLDQCSARDRIDQYETVWNGAHRGINADLLLVSATDPIRVPSQPRVRWTPLMQRIYGAMDSTRWQTAGELRQRANCHVQAIHSYGAHLVAAGWVEAKTERFGGRNVKWYRRRAA